MCKIQNISDNPFSRFSAEEEENLRDIFIKPRYYDALKSNAKQGNSRILVGQRGLGKSATIHMLFLDLKANKTMPILITRYDGIPLTNNKGFFLYKIIQALTKRIAEHLYKNPKDSNKLTKQQKKALSYFIEIFFDEEVAEEYMAEAKAIKGKKRINWIRGIFNRHLRLINSVVSGAARITASVIRESMGLPSEMSETEVVEFFNEIPLAEIKTMTMSQVVSKGNDFLLSMIKQEIDIVLSLGYDSIVVLFDKIDEYSEVNSDISKVADFTLPILKDTDLLYTSKLSIVFSLWSEVKRTLNAKGVRFDKFQDIDISWRDDELEEIINKRLFFYSINKTIPVTLKSLVPFDNDRATILRLADGSPRSLISLMGRLYDEELRNVEEQNTFISFSPSTIVKGLIEFCKRFDYESLRPSMVSDRQNYYNWLNKVLLMKKPYFTIAEVSGVFGVKNTTAQRYINEMEKMGIIEQDFLGEEDNPRYHTIDPRICYLMSRGITNLS